MIYQIQNGLEKDDVLLGNMIKVCSKTKEAERAIKLWKEMKDLKGINLTSLHYNAIIMALSS